MFVVVFQQVCTDLGSVTYGCEEPDADRDQAES